MLMDGTCYYTLQEGVEAKNKVDKSDARGIYKGDIPGVQSNSPFQYMLDQQTCKGVTTELKRQLPN